MPQTKPLVARKIRPSTPLKLDATEFQIGFDFDALARIEDRGGVKLEVAFDWFDLWRKITPAKVLAATVWSTICTFHPQYDSDQGYRVISSLLDSGNVAAAVDALVDAYAKFLSPEHSERFLKAMRKTEEVLETENPPKPAATSAPPAAANSTGSGSGPSPATISASASANSAS